MMSKGHGRSVISNEHPTGWVSAVAAYLFFFFFFPVTLDLRLERKGLVQWG